MGLLDDAIREHLELKRRRGADPSAVAREEREALRPTSDGTPAAGRRGRRRPSRSRAPRTARERCRPATRARSTTAVRSSTRPRSRDASNPPQETAELDMQRDGGAAAATAWLRSAESPDPMQAAPSSRSPRGSAAMGGSRARGTASRAGRRGGGETAVECARPAPRSGRALFVAASPTLEGFGAIAQLGERLLCKQEVTGSIPVGSTRKMPTKTYVLMRAVTSQ